ncbi:transposase (plasmid) [Paraburkholderia sp. 22B1P]|nr:transposase [Paraburkholderia sp. 22B1P]
MHELERVKIIEAVVQHRLTIVLAAGRLQLCERQVSRLVRRYEAAGPAGLVSARRGQPSNRELPVDVRARTMALVRERYADFGPTLACEKLRECHGVVLAKETVRRWMRDAGLWMPGRQRPPKIYQPRARRACLGELIQIDGSEHAWFEQRAPQCTLLVYVDDATSRLMHLHFTVSESTFSYFEATRAYVELHGKPMAFYSDRASVFRPTHTQTGDRLAVSTAMTTRPTPSKISA